MWGMEERCEVGVDKEIYSEYVMRGKLDELIDPVNCFNQQQEMCGTYHVKVGETEWDGDTSACVLLSISNDDAKLISRYLSGEGHFK